MVRRMDTALIRTAALIQTGRGVERRGEERERGRSMMDDMMTEGGGGEGRDDEGLCVLLLTTEAKAIALGC